MSGDSVRSTQRFSNRVDNYIRYRPAYPPAVLEILNREIGLDASWKIADVGSGTGISSELFLRNGNAVYGVEPNAPMRQAAERLLAGYPNFHSIDGSAEATALPDRCVDAVVAAQAFHWFDAQRARQESLRILKSGGWAVLLWNTRRIDSTPFLRAYEALLLDHGTDYRRVRHDQIDKDLLTTYFDGKFTTRSVVNQQRLTLEGLRGRLFSASYVPAPGEPGSAAMMQAVDRMFHEHQCDGGVVVQYDAELFFSQLA